MAAWAAMMPEPMQRLNVLRVEGRDITGTQDNIAEEIPVALLYNGRSHAVMMATPADLDDFAIGFTLTEGIVECAADVDLIDCVSGEYGVSLHLLIPQARYDLLDMRQRQMSGRTGCGLCGAATLEAAVRPVRRLSAVAPVSRDSLQAALHGLHDAQRLNRATGAMHAAALLCAGHAPDQKLIVREDIGRHNAIDKAIGAAARGGHQGLVMAVTSRASYEVVHKAAQAGCQLVAAISAPTGLAIRLAEEAGVTLVGFARGERMTIYAQPQGLQL